MNEFDANGTISVSMIDADDNLRDERAPGGKGGPSVESSKPSLTAWLGCSGMLGATACRGLGITNTLGRRRSNVVA